MLLLSLSYASKCIAIADPKDLAVDGEILAEVEIAKVVRVTLIVLRKAMSTDQFTLREAAVLLDLFEDLQAVVFEIVEDFDRSDAVVLVGTLRNRLFEVAEEAKDFLVEGQGSWNEFIRRFNNGLAIDELGTIVSEKLQFVFADLIVVDSCTAQADLRPFGDAMAILHFECMADMEIGLLQDESQYLSRHRTKAEDRISYSYVLLDHERNFRADKVNLPLCFTHVT